MFSKLRDLRKEIAQAEGVPVYTVFNNEQLAQIVQRKARSKADFETIFGVGDARITKYGDHFVEFLSQQGSADETDGEPV
jgi:superfamily II DNA helicase RecQ